jgi:hypothetical protein
MKSADFLMDPSLEMPGRLVGLFFGDNRGYFDMKARQVEVPPAEFEVASYVSMIKDTGSEKFDDRCSCIELQADQQIALSRDSVLAVVLPSVYLDDPTYRDKILGEWGATPLPYSQQRANPNEYVGLIYEKVREFLASEGYFGAI